MNTAPSTASQASLLFISEYLRLFPDQAAELLESAGALETAQLLSLLHPKIAGSVLSVITPAARARVIENLEGEYVRPILRAIDPGKLVIALVQLPEEIVDRLLGEVGDRFATVLRELMTYPAHSVWHLMDGNVLSFRAGLPAGEALKRIQAAGVRNTARFYLVDEDGKLFGFVPLQDLALAPPDQPLGEIARPPPPSVKAIESSEEVMRLFEEQKTSTIPVVDFEGKLLGAIRYEGLVNAAQQEALEGIQSMVGASPDELALSSPWFSVRKRLPWLQINLATAFLAAAVVGIFEDLIAQFTALAVLLPVVAGQSGNTGAQALAVSVRGLTLKEITVDQWLPIVRKELYTGFINGCAVAVVTGAGAWIWSRSWGLVSVISISMIIAMMIAGSAGAMVPIVLKSLKQDPAQSSSIILTTITDIFGFLSFLGLATILSRFLI